METLHRCFYLFMTINCACLTYAEAFQGFKRPCKDSTPECLRRSLQIVFPEFINGFPELGIEPLDPLVMKNLLFSMPGLNVTIDEGYINGLRDCIVESVRKLDGDEYDIILRCDLLVRGKYRSSGQLLIFPLDGEGIATVVCKNFMSKMNFRLEPTRKADGQIYLQGNSFTSKYSFSGQVSLDLPNILEMSPIMHNTALYMLNQNWLELANKYGQPVANFGSISIWNNLQKLLNIVPMNRLEAV